MRQNDKRGTQSVDRAVELLRFVSEHSAQGIRLVDATRRTGLSKPTAHRLLRALEKHGLVKLDANSGRYTLGAEAFVIGTLATEQYGIHRAALPFLAELSHLTQDTAFLLVRRNWHAVCLHREEGSYPIRSHALQPGDRHPLGIGSGSMAILATMSDDAIEEALRANAEEIKRRWPASSVRALRADIQRTREVGYSFNPGHLNPGSCGVGVAVIGARGECEGALSIAAIESRLSKTRRREIGALLQKAATRLSEQLMRPRDKT